MAYDMNAEAVNGVQQTTVICNNNGGNPVGGEGWILPFPAPAPTPSQDINGAAVLFVTAVQGGPDSLDLVALQCAGNGKGPGVIGQSTGGEFGVAGPGIGVAGFNVTGFAGSPAVDTDNPIFIFNLATEQTAGVFGQCDGGPGVKGQGGDAKNPPNDFPNNNPVDAGFGVIGIGGKAGAASMAKFPPLPAGAGVVGVAGGAAMPAAAVTASTGIVGMGSPAAHGFSPGRGGVFGSAGNIAQVQLIPAPGGRITLPRSGRFGDLYVTLIEGQLRSAASMFLCVIPDDPTATPPTVAQWHRLSWVRSKRAVTQQSRPQPSPN